jgi:hypothetical protein
MAVGFLRRAPSDFLISDDIHVLRLRYFAAPV